MRKIELDRIDHKILSLLQSQGRLSNSDLSEKVGLSPSACLRRVQNLEATGVIRNYVALIDPAALNLKATIIVEIALHSQSEEDMLAFEEAVSNIEEILECQLMTGDYDYILKIIAADAEDFGRIHRQHLSRLPGVSRMRSSFALRTVFKKTAYPVKS